MLVLDSWWLVEETEPIVTIPTPHNSAWLHNWNNHIEGVSILLLVPALACLIHTPLVKPKWAQALQTYPLKFLAEFFFKGITFGFCIGYNHSGRPLRSAHKNLECALLHPEIVEDYLETEVVNYQVAGPYNKKSCPNAQIWGYPQM